jgi:hypothetical protein
MSDKELYNLSGKWDLPKKEVSCPSCSKEYGSYNRKVCMNCEECSKCCQCNEQKFISAEKFVNSLEI